eukprot:Sspe_Gene.90697::Locus_62194_Transcript_1_1_Confidence_1.000_Length_889::g.90697::m.90697
MEKVGSGDGRDPSTSSVQFSLSDHSLDSLVPPPSPCLDAAYRDGLVSFYQEHNPEKLGEVDEIIAVYHGRYNDLLRSLAQKYSLGLEQVISYFPVHLVRENDMAQLQDDIRRAVAWSLGEQKGPEVVRAVETLRTIVVNVLTFPRVERYRVISTSNAVFRRTAAPLRDLPELLMKVGFVAEGSRLVLPQGTTMVPLSILCSTLARVTDGDRVQEGERQWLARMQWLRSEGNPGLGALLAPSSLPAHTSSSSSSSSSSSTSSGASSDE